MTRRHWAGLPWPLIVLALAGCAGHSAPTATPLPVPTAALGATGGSTEAVAGRFRLRLDLAALAGEITPDATRSAQRPQGFAYDLDPNQFLKAETLQLRNVRREASGDITLAIEHRHPFGAPDFASPDSATNRADLGYTGRLMILNDLKPGQVAAHTWFTDVVANTDLVVNADGYVNPGDLMVVGPTNANTFPFLLLVDEAQDNRIGISNGGDPIGSYALKDDGWQRLNAGSSGTNWTGYDYLHAGQASLIEVTLNSKTLPTSTVDLELALLIKYTQPKAVGGPTYRFPPAPEDWTKFAYRLPFAAIDASALRLANPVLMLAEPFAEAPIDLRLRDWDAYEDEAGDDDISDEPDLDLIQPGGFGAPSLEVDCPSLWGTSPVGIAADPFGSGSPGDEIPYLGTLQNLVSTTTPDTYHALARAIDPEGIDPERGTYAFGLDPFTLTPDPARALQPITYQHVPITLIAPPTVPIWSKHFVGGSQRIAFEQDKISIVSLTDGRLAISYNRGDLGNPTDIPELWLALSSGPSPLGPGDWALSPIDQSPINGTYAHMIEENGRLICAYLLFGIGAEDMGIAVANTVTPTGLSSWNRYALETVDQTGRESWLGLLNGNAALSYQNYPFGLKFARATVAHPASPSDWVIQEVDTGAPNGAYGSTWTLWNGNPVIAHRYWSTSEVRLAVASTPTPSSPGDWTLGTIDPTSTWLADFTGLNCGLAVTGGKLAIAFGQVDTKALRVGLTDAAVPVAPEDWSFYTLDTFGIPGGDLDLSTIDDRLVLAYHVDLDPDPSNYLGALKVARAAVDVPTGAGVWQKQMVDAGGVSGTAIGHLPRVIEHNGGIWVAYESFPVGQLGAWVSYSNTLW